MSSTSGFEQSCSVPVSPKITAQNTAPETIEIVSPVAIINPQAGKGSLAQRWHGLAKQLLRHYRELEILETCCRGHATQLCRQALERGSTMVISVGGDGTANEVLGGFMDERGTNVFPQSCLGLIAAGSGGDFQRNFGRLSPQAQVQEFAGTRVQSMDYGVACFVDHQGQRRVRAFLNVASVGLSGHVVAKIGGSSGTDGLGDRSSSGGAPVHIGRYPTLSYLRAALQGIAKYRNRPVDVAYNRGVPRRVDLNLACIANGQYFGSGMWVSPKSQVDDGHFDVIELENLNRIQLLATLAKVYQGRHLRVAGIRSTRAKFVEFRVPGPYDVLLEVDGESLGKLPASFEMVSGGIAVKIVTGDLSS